jgi:uncharacterized iron-regulated protein
VQLLLVLSALLTGLTGLIGGERVVEAQQLERSVVAAAVVVDSLAAAPAARQAVSALVAFPSLASVRGAHFAFIAPAPRLRLRVDERRRE